MTTFGAGLVTTWTTFTITFGCATFLGVAFVTVCFAASTFGAFATTLLETGPVESGEADVLDEAFTLAEPLTEPDALAETPFAVA
ncbi:MAG: hypothetical protein JO186_05340, partial [Actinobacteria bacterium]|nr:hypothetical protein [Actinomycetota bacterium]